MSSWMRIFSACKSESATGAVAAHCYFNDTSVIVPPISKMCGLPSIVSRRDMGFWYTPLILQALRLVRRYVTFGPFVMQKRSSNRFVKRRVISAAKFQ